MPFRYRSVQRGEQCNRRQCTPRGPIMNAVLACLQCIVWFFVISVCIGETVMNLSSGHESHPNLLLSRESGLADYVHPACLLLLALMHTPAIRRYAVGISIVVGALLFTTVNWFAAALIVASGAVTLWMSRRDATADMGPDVDHDDMTPSSAHPAKQVDERGADEVAMRPTRSRPSASRRRMAGYPLG